MSIPQELLDSIRTDVTSTVHQKAYPAISPSRPELSQAGKTILISGGGTGIGKSMAENFALASAATVILVGRREDVLKKAASELEGNAKTTQSPTKFITRSCDVTKSADITALWSYLSDQSIKVDVLVLNAAKFSEAKTLLELGTDELWYHFEVNVKGNVQLAEAFYNSPSDGQKVSNPDFLIHTSSAAIHALRNPMVSQHPSYNLTKAAGTLAVQLVADSTTPGVMQVINFHPGLILTDAFNPSRFTPEMLDSLPFDDVNLPGAFAVWAASKEAEFLHGRFVWAAWDVDELSRGGLRKRIDGDHDFLRIGVTGLKDAKLA